MLETARLLLRPPRLADAPALLGFMGDAEAMRFTHHVASLREMRRRIAAHERQRARIGCAPWTLLGKADGKIIGWGGLYLDPFDPGWGVEVAYFFAPTAWGSGYATEFTRFCVAFAREHLRLPELIAFAHPDNLASRRVLQKAGFIEERFVPEMERYLFHQRLP